MAAEMFLVPYFAIRRLTLLHGRAGEPVPEESVRFREAFRIPLVRAVMPATAAVALGLGALFSLGIVFVREVLDATDAEFGVLIALFGVGAVGGLAVLQMRRGHERIAETRLGVAAIGIVVAVFSLAGSMALAFVGAAA